MSRQTPPLGENLFVASGISKLSIEQIFIKVPPVTGTNFAALFVIAYTPALSL